MLWIKAFHVIFMVTWFAGLFYLPRLFVYHSMETEPAPHERFVVMERRLLKLMTIGAIATAIFGFWLLFAYWWETLASAAWLHAKLVLIVLLVGYHAWCGKIVADFREGRNRRGHVFYRWFNELPSLALIAVVVLAVVKPF